MRRLLLVLLLLAAPGLVDFTRPAGAATVAQQPPASPAQEGFVPVDDTAVGQERMPAAPLVAAAYAVAWAAVLAYVWLLWRRLGAVEQELKQLAGRMQR